jgi:hypothetical protein
VEVGLHELFIKIHFIEIPVQAKDNVHVIQASDLRPKQGGMRQGKIRISPLPSDVGKQKPYILVPAEVMQEPSRLSQGRVTGWRWSQVINQKKKRLRYPINHSVGRAKAKEMVAKGVKRNASERSDRNAVRT